MSPVSSCESTDFPNEHMQHFPNSQRRKTQLQALDAAKDYLNCTTDLNAFLELLDEIGDDQSFLARMGRDQSLARMG